MAWQSVQICKDCWYKMNWHEPFRVTEDYTELTKCADCGTPTKSGIYVRRDVQAVS